MRLQYQLLQYQTGTGLPLIFGQNVWNSALISVTFVVCVSHHKRGHHKIINNNEFLV